MKTSALCQLPQVRPLGRYAGLYEPRTLFYTGSGIDCLYTGSQLHLHLNAGSGQYETWLAVELDGAWLARFPVAEGESKVCLFRGLAPGQPRRLRVMKETQPMSGDPGNFLQITALDYDGEFLPLPAPRYRLEFVGDSITSGEGAVGAQCADDWVPTFFSGENTYPRMVAADLHADWRVVSQSGWGILSGWDNDPRHRVLPHYQTVCGLADGPENLAGGARQPYDFAAWPADAVIVNLGTNDEHAMHNPAWTDPDTGREYAQRDTPENRARLTQAVMDGLALLRRRNPRALLVWCGGMLDRGLCPLLKEAVGRYSAETGDRNARFLLLPRVNSTTLGARHHPGRAAHRAAADIITDFLRKNLPASPDVRK